MPAYLIKSSDEMQRQAIKLLERNTPLTATSPGSVLRFLTEIFTSELGDMYSLLDFNMSQQLVSTASGSALDRLASLYNVPARKTVSNLVTIDKLTGAFQFYLLTPYGSNIIIPKGTNVYTDSTTFVGQQYSYVTSEDTIIPAGRLRAYASITPKFTDSVFTAGVNTLIIHDFQAPAGVTILCKNNKSIQAQIGFEDDDSFRTRIIKQIRVSASGTAEAVRFSALAVPGVRDARVRQAPYGLGSFEIIVIPEEYNTANVLIDKVVNAISTTRPVGVRAFVKKPTTKTISMSFDLVVPAADSVLIADASTQKARLAASRYLASLLPGDTLVYNKLIQSILDSSDIIRDVIVKTFTISGSETARRNYQSEPDVHLVPGTISVGIARA